MADAGNSARAPQWQPPLTFIFASRGRPNHSISKLSIKRWLTLMLMALIQWKVEPTIRPNGLPSMYRITGASSF
jgi:hypothetical protein